MLGHSVPVYAYSLNNPIAFIDPNGMRVRVSGRFNGYRVNDPTCISSRVGKTCYEASYYIGRCRKQDCKWKFDIDVNYDITIGFNENADPSRPDETGDETVWAHEHRHLKDIVNALNDSILNELIPTEGFLSRGACEAARVSAKPRLDEYLQDLTRDYYD